MPRKPKTDMPETRRSSDEVKANKAEKLARDPVFQEFFADLHEEYLRDIEAAQLDGTIEAEKRALTAVHRFQALMDLKRTIFQPIRKQRMADRASENRTARNQ